MIRYFLFNVHWVRFWNMYWVRLVHVHLNRVWYNFFNWVWLRDMYGYFNMIVYLLFHWIRLRHKYFIRNADFLDYRVRLRNKNFDWVGLVDMNFYWYVNWFFYGIGMGNRYRHINFNGHGVGYFLFDWIRLWYVHLHWNMDNLFYWNVHRFNYGVGNLHIFYNCHGFLVVLVSTSVVKSTIILLASMSFRKPAAAVASVKTTEIVSTIITTAIPQFNTTFILLLILGFCGFRICGFCFGL